MKILITGAGGLLGRCMTTTFVGAGHRTISTRHHAHSNDDSVLDVLNEEECMTTIGSIKPDWIINCAAERNPDRCVTHPEDAYRINALAVEFLARAASRHGAGLCQISTDYVFSGSNPPYRETDRPSPVIIYGRSKLAGEFAAQSARRHLIVRTSALYRLDQTDPANVLTRFATSLREGKELHLDSKTVRYYTLADEVAQAVEYILSKDVLGIIHISSRTASNRIAFASGVASAIGASASLIQESASISASAERPLNTHLDTSLYESMGGPILTDLTPALARFKKSIHAS
jgi:dTDP-4-dehydrorhamnose reductase